jgi:uncharacterized protein (DUF362 family)
VAPDTHTGPENRRQFLRRLAAAGLLAAGVSAGGWWFSRRPAYNVAPDEKRVSLPDFAVRDTSACMSIVHGADRRRSLQRGLAALGGLQRFVGRGERVLLKVNAAFAVPPNLGATTHPDLVAAAVEACLQAGAAHVAVTDNPINDPAACFALTGIGAAARGAGARVILPRKAYFRPLTVKKARLIRRWPVLYHPLENIDRVIGLAPVKDHHRSGGSMSLKNWYGLLGGRRSIFHQDINTIIRDLGLMMRPTLVFLDGTVTMMTNGPTGGSLSDLKHTGTLIVSTDQVAADAFGTTLLGKVPAELPYIGMCRQAGLGTDDYRSLNPVVLSG